MLYIYIYNVKENMDKNQGVKVFLLHIPMEVFMKVVSEASKEEKSYSWVINDALLERFKRKEIK